MTRVTVRIGIPAALSLVWGLAGCATGPSRNREAATVAMEVYAMPAGAGTLQGLAAGSVLRSGDQFSVKVEASAPAYLYLIHETAGEAAQVLSPAPGAAPVQVVPRLPVHLPAGDSLYPLDQRAGTETLRLLASRTKLAPDAVLSAAAQAPSPQTERGRGDPPPDIPEKRRGERVQAPLKPTGVTVLRFWFRHE